jgi:putative ATP-dependent endonuclease of OLD family
MYINHVWIKGFRNIRDTDFQVNKRLILIGENNSGKSNILKAITLPLSPSADRFFSRTMTLRDFNNTDKDIFYKYVRDNFDKLTGDQCDDQLLKEFITCIPKVTVRLQFEMDNESKYYFQKLITNSDREEDEFVYQIEYQYQIDNPNKLIDHLKNIKNILQSDEDAELLDIQMNLLPMNLYKAHIVVPGKNESVSYEIIKNLNFFTLVAERDGFSANRSKIGSSAIIELLNRNIDDRSKMNIEKGYNDFFKEIKGSTRMDEVFNWAKYTKNIINATDFFGDISVLPNMPPMNSLLNNIQLGFDNEPLSQQGLGYRNLVYLTAMINALESDDEIPFAILSLEEPEAHLSNENQKLLMSFLDSTSQYAPNFQLMYSTHNVNFLPKLSLEDVVIINKGEAVSVKSEMNVDDIEYLVRNPNLDIYKLLFSTNVMLVEGLSEELLIKSVLRSKKNSLNNIEIISFHKGFSSIIKLWKKINQNSNRKLAVIRDFDKESDAKKRTESLEENGKIYVGTTMNYTLEDDIIKNNSKTLSIFFEQHLDWPDEVLKNVDSILKHWKNKKGAKGEAMFEISTFIGTEELKDFVLPEHIEKAINFFGD